MDWISFAYQLVMYHIPVGTCNRNVKTLNFLKETENRWESIHRGLIDTSTWMFK